MSTTILSLILFFFAGCTITTYQYPSDPLIIENYHDPYRIMIHPIPRYRSPIHYNNYYRRTPMKNRTVRRHNGVRVYRKNYWSGTTKHPQPEKRKQEHDSKAKVRKPSERRLPQNFKKRLQERRKTWQEKRRSSKDR